MTVSTQLRRIEVVRRTWFNQLGILAWSMSAFRKLLYSSSQLGRVAKAEWELSWTSSGDGAASPSARALGIEIANSQFATSSAAATPSSSVAARACAGRSAKDLGEAGIIGRFEMTALASELPKELLERSLKPRQSTPTNRPSSREVAPDAAAVMPPCEAPSWVSQQLSEAADSRTDSLDGALGKKSASSVTCSAKRVTSSLCRMRCCWTDFCKESFP
mmetsp:Transcript_114996/g.365395  ORF Transcript_114996/g.365395 Transcript_114996/m.365395 type:complete len:218 (+) Transcript_114996:1457-2110(+)